MANFNTNLYLGQNGSAGGSLNAGANFPMARDAGGKLRYLVIPYTVDGAEASGDTITLGKLKVGAKLIPALSRVVSDTGFDVDDMDIGIAGNVNKYADDIDTLDTASDISFGVAGDNAYTPTAVESGGETIIATLVNVVTTTAAGKVLFLIGFLDE
jgi:hypothetical protein